MADRFIAALNQIERQMKDMILSVSSDHTPFHEFVSEIQGEKMSDNDYFRILETFYGEYMRKQQSKAQMYCLMRMIQLEKAQNVRWMRKMFPKIEFSNAPNPSLKAFIDRKRPFYQALSDKIERKCVLISTAIVLIILPILILSLNLNSFLSLLIVFSLWGFLLRLSSRWIVPTLLQERIGMLSSKLSDVHQGFEKGMKFKNPPLVLFDMPRFVKSGTRRLMKAFC